MNWNEAKAAGHGNIGRAIPKTHGRANPGDRTYCNRPAHLLQTVTGAEYHKCITCKNCRKVLSYLASKRNG